MVQLAGEEVSQLCAKFDHRRRGEAEEGRHEGDLVDLLGGGLGELVAAVADVHIPEAGEGVHEAVAVAVPEVDALAAGEDERAFFAKLLEVGEGVQKVRLVLRDEVGGVPGLSDRHDQSFRYVPNGILGRRVCERVPNCRTRGAAS